jgi:hypothetical protein
MEHSSKRSQVERLYRQGMSYSGIARLVGLSRQRVHQMVRPDATVCAQVMERAKGKCEDCGVVMRSGHFHHMESNPQAAVDGPSNIRYLCPGCHRKRHPRKGLSPLTFWCPEPLVHRFRQYAYTHSSMDETKILRAALLAYLNRYAK